MWTATLPRSSSCLLKKKSVDCGVYYIRNNHLLLAKINVRDPSLSVSFSDLAFLASHFSFDGSGAR